MSLGKTLLKVSNIKKDRECFVGGYLMSLDETRLKVSNTNIKKDKE